MNKALEDVNAERMRQIEIEGWTPRDDDRYRDGELLQAAVSYLWHGTDKASPLKDDGVPMGWPWSALWWKPKDRRANLVRAGALCVAEKDRIIRAFRPYRPKRLPSVRCRPPATEPSFAHVEHKLDLIIAEIERLDRISQSSAPSLQPLSMTPAGRSEQCKPANT